MAGELTKRKSEARELLVEELTRLTKERDYYKAESARLREEIDDMQVVEDA